MSKIFNLTINGQGSYLASERVPVAGTTGHYLVHPTFSEEWSVAATKIIAFVWSKPQKYGAPHTVKVGVEWDGTNDVAVPQSVVANEGTLVIGALGLNEAGTTVISTHAVEGSIEVLEAIARNTADLNGDSEDDVDIWAQTNQRMDELETQIEGKADAFEIGAGLTLDNDTLALNQASENSLGGIKVGENLSIDDDGTLNADAQPAILYSGTGQATDGAMNQKATTDQLAAKQDALTAGDGIIIENNEVAIDTDTIAQVADIPQKTSDLENDGADGSDPFASASDLASVEAEIPTTVAELTDSSDYVTQTQLSQAITSAYKYKGSVASYENLPSSGQTVGDVYNVESAHGTIPAGTNYAWNGTAWDALAGSVDLSSYATIAYVNTQVGDIETILETLTTGTGA